MSNREELTLFSYEILGLVGRAGAAPHDLLRMARRGRMLDWAGESQYYVEPKRLARLGYLEARKAPGRTRERTVYTLTDRGLDALAHWARTPVHFTALKSEALLRRSSPTWWASRPLARACSPCARTSPTCWRGSRRPRRRPRSFPTGASTCCS